MTHSATFAIVLLWVAVVALLAIAIVVQQRQKAHEGLDAETRAALDVAREMQVAPEQVLTRDQGESTAAETPDPERIKIDELVRQLAENGDDLALRQQLVEAFLDGGEQTMAVQQLFVLADLQSKGGDEQSAQASYRRILDLDANNLQAQRFLGMIDDDT